MNTANTSISAAAPSFRTYEYRIYPTQEQKVGMNCRFDDVDAALRDSSDLVNELINCGATADEIKKRSST